MKIELFFKTPVQLASVMTLISSRPCLESCNFFNIPNKMREENLLPYARQILDEMPSANVCLHYSLKNHRAKTLEEATNSFIEFISNSHSIGVKEVLLVSGSGDTKRKINSLSCLQRLSEQHYRPPADVALSVAFNPYCSTEAEKEMERQRLIEKLRYDCISIVYLQFGSDITKLEDSLAFLDANVDRTKVQIYGSVFLPSKQLIARMKFRPWKGLLLTPDFLSTVEKAESIVLDMLSLYKAHNILPIIETAFRTEKEATDMERLLGLQERRREST